MALIKCPECSKEVSDTAKSCPHCGYGIKKELKNLEKSHIYQDIYNNVEMPQEPKSPSIVGIIVDLCVFVVAIIAVVCGIVLYKNSSTFDEEQLATSIIILSATAILITGLIPVGIYSSYNASKKEYNLSIQDPNTYKKRIADTKIKDVKLPSDGNKNEYTFHYLASFFIPLVGFVLGAILLSKDDEEIRDKGKNCIWLGIASIILTFIIVSLETHHIL